MQKQISAPAMCTKNNGFKNEQLTVIFLQYDEIQT